ncbi:hypothetical protein MACH17_18330 [Phaeobacter inhibens]|uniref:hypothetical protein n=1 Tax=Phaeobacter inhibens TaxID=221822 RepID=UPI002778F6DA|nr:hypothetical protein [Phaeobacter inhibens]GLO70316.1 hypothetical protein MACH17_18330 [Phaeobacter inhibens]
MTGFATDNPAQHIAALESAKRFEREQFARMKARQFEKDLFSALSTKAKLLSTTAIRRGSVA